LDQATKDTSQYPERTLRVLVADDCRLDQLVAIRLLERCGHQVEVVDNGLSAVAVVQQSPFDAVLMDIEMPELDGLAATRSIRESEQRGSRLPIIAVSASGQERTCLDSGCDFFISKPLTLNRLQVAFTSVGLGANLSSRGNSPRHPGFRRCHR
jgi:CheY-like chemotaxis protein